MTGTGTNWVEIGGIAQLCAAGGTLVLAGFTWWMARKTRDAAKATARTADAGVKAAEAANKEADAVLEQSKSVAAQVSAVSAQAAASAEQLELTRRGLESSVQPWLILGDPDQRSPRGTVRGPGIHSLTPAVFVMHSESVNQGTDRLLASVAIRNVGSGLALIDPQRCWIWGQSDPRGEDPHPMQYVHPEVRNPVLPREEQTSLEFEIDLKGFLTTFEGVTHSHQTAGELWFDIFYSDVAGYGSTRARLHVGSSPRGNAWIADWIEYFTPPDAEEGLKVTFR